MKRSRTVSIEVEQRRLVISIVRGGTSSPPATKQTTTEDSGPVPDACPECGSAWVTFNGVSIATRDAEAPPKDLSAITLALRQGGFHFHTLPNGQLRICSGSLSSASSVTSASEMQLPGKSI